MLTENKVRLLIAKAFSLKEIVDAKTNEYNKTRSQIYEFLEQTEQKSMRAKVPAEHRDNSIESEELVATRVDKVTSITYDTEALRKKLDKELFNEIVDKTYTIVDIEGLKSLLKKAGVSPKEFKKYLHVTESVNGAKLQQAYSTGEIDLKSISGAYNVRLSKSIQIRKVRGGD